MTKCPVLACQPTSFPFFINPPYQAKSTYIWLCKRGSLLGLGLEPFQHPICIPIICVFSSESQVSRTFLVLPWGTRMNVTDHRVPSIFHVLHVADGPLLDVPGVTSRA